jgi:hypothetical protein
VVLVLAHLLVLLVCLDLLVYLALLGCLALHHLQVVLFIIVLHSTSSGGMLVSSLLVGFLVLMVELHLLLLLP